MGVTLLVGWLEVGKDEMIVSMSEEESGVGKVANKRNES